MLCHIDPVIFGNFLTVFCLTCEYKKECTKFIYGPVEWKHFNKIVLFLEMCSP